MKEKRFTKLENPYPFFDQTRIINTTKDFLFDEFSFAFTKKKIVSSHFTQNLKIIFTLYDQNTSEICRSVWNFDNSFCNT